MVYPHNFVLAGRVGDLQPKCKASRQVPRLPAAACLDDAPQRGPRHPAMPLSVLLSGGALL
jgi:hypothetical protein